MPFDQVFGQEKAIGTLRKALIRQRLAHAYLFVGPEGVGKHLTALNLAKAMNCSSPPREGDCCEGCPSCLKVNSQNHADVISIGAEKSGIRIDQIRELQRRLSYQPMEGGRRACIIDPADQMNEAAANALLKTLEEPPAKTYLFLITAKPHLLLSTILSRCQWVRFKALAPGHIVRILKNGKDLDDDRAHFCASLAGGSAEKAMALGNQTNFEKRLEWLHLFAEIRDFNLEEILNRSERMAKGEEEAEEWLEIWKLWVRDLMVWKIRGKAGEASLMNRDLAAQADREAAQYTFEQLEALFELLSRIQTAMAANANLQLALEAGFLEMRKIQGGKGQAPLGPGRDRAGLASGTTL